jgi:hypothetical protein
VAERLADAKSQGKKAFANGEYFASIHYYGLVNARNYTCLGII